jgi:HAD superfamily hydrolase (TIGR01490 family)
MTNLALFDLDHTLLPIDSDHAWGRFMVENGIVDAEDFAQTSQAFYDDYHAGCLDIDAYLRFALTPLAKYPRARLDDWHAQFMRETITPAILQPALELVRSHRERGDLCCMITATNLFVTAPIGAAFGIDSVIACEAATEGGLPDGRYTGEPKGVPSFREGKIVRAEAWLAAQGYGWSSFERSFFYSDSHNDIPLLEKVTDPIAANPDDKLREYARMRGWRIIDLFTPK